MAGVTGVSSLGRVACEGCEWTFALQNGNLRSHHGGCQAAAPRTGTQSERTRSAPWREAAARSRQSAAERAAVDAVLERQGVDAASAELARAAIRPRAAVQERSRATLEKI